MCATAFLCRHRDELVLRRRQIVIQFDLNALRLILDRLNLLNQAPLVDRDAHMRAEHLHFAVAHIQPVTDLDKITLICSDEAGREEKQRRSDRRAGGTDVQLGRSALSSAATRLHVHCGHGGASSDPSRDRPHSPCCELSNALTIFEREQDGASAIANEGLRVETQSSRAAAVAGVSRVTSTRQLRPIARRLTRMQPAAQLPSARRSIARRSCLSLLSFPPLRCDVAIHQPECD